MALNMPSRRAVDTYYSQLASLESEIRQHKLLTKDLVDIQKNERKTYVDSDNKTMYIVGKNYFEKKRL